VREEHPTLTAPPFPRPRPRLPFPPGPTPRDRRSGRERARGDVTAAISQQRCHSGGDAASGRTLFVERQRVDLDLHGRPGRRQPPAAGPCDNYSTALLSSADGTSIFEIATYDPGSGCTAYMAGGPLPASTGGGGGGGGSTASQAVVGAGSNRCLDIRSSATADGTPVQLWDCSDAWNQKWSYAGGQLLNP
jgi:hypothetical protein